MEGCVAVIMVGLTAFRSLFVTEGARRAKKRAVPIFLIEGSGIACEHPLGIRGWPPSVNSFRNVYRLANFRTRGTNRVVTAVGSEDSAILNGNNSPMEEKRIKLTHTIMTEETL